MFDRLLRGFLSWHEWSDLLRALKIPELSVEDLVHYGCPAEVLNERGLRHSDIELMFKDRDFQAMHNYVYNSHNFSYNFTCISTALSLLITSRMTYSDLSALQQAFSYEEANVISNEVQMDAEGEVGGRKRKVKTGHGGLPLDDTIILKTLQLAGKSMSRMQIADFRTSCTMAVPGRLQLYEFMMVAAMAVDRKSQDTAVSAAIGQQSREVYDSQRGLYEVQDVKKMIPVDDDVVRQLDAEYKRRPLPLTRVMEISKRMGLQLETRQHADDVASRRGSVGGRDEQPGDEEGYGDHEKTGVRFAASNAKNFSKGVTVSSGVGPGLEDAEDLTDRPTSRHIPERLRFAREKLRQAIVTSHLDVEHPLDVEATPFDTTAEMARELLEATLEEQEDFQRLLQAQRAKNRRQLKRKESPTQHLKSMDTTSSDPAESMGGELASIEANPFQTVSVTSGSHGDDGLARRSPSGHSHAMSPVDSGHRSRRNSLASALLARRSGSNRSSPNPSAAMNSLDPDMVHAITPHELAADLTATISNIHVNITGVLGSTGPRALLDPVRPVSSASSRPDTAEGGKGGGSGSSWPTLLTMVRGLYAPGDFSAPALVEKWSYLCEIFKVAQGDGEGATIDSILAAREQQHGNGGKKKMAAGKMSALHKRLYAGGSQFGVRGGRMRERPRSALARMNAAKAGHRPPPVDPLELEKIHRPRPMSATAAMGQHANASHRSSTRATELDSAPSIRGWSASTADRRPMTADPARREREREGRRERPMSAMPLRAGGRASSLYRKPEEDAPTIQMRRIPRGPRPVSAPPRKSRPVSADTTAKRSMAMRMSSESPSPKKENEIILLLDGAEIEVSPPTSPVNGRPPKPRAIAAATKGSVRPPNLSTSNRRPQSAGPQKRAQSTDGFGSYGGMDFSVMNEFRTGNPSGNRVRPLSGKQSQRMRQSLGMYATELIRSANFVQADPQLALQRSLLKAASKTAAATRKRNTTAATGPSAERLHTT